MTFWWDFNHITGKWFWTESGFGRLKIELCPCLDKCSSVSCWSVTGKTRDTCHVLARVCSHSNDQSSRLANWRLLCSDYFQCTDVVNTMHISFIALLLVTASFDKSETEALSMGPCLSHRLWLLIVREMVMCGPPPSVPDMVPSTSQGLFHCCGLHLAPYVIPNSKCKWALCYSRKIDH